MASIRQIVDCVHADENLTAFARLKVEIGRLALRKNSRPPRITWVPSDAPITPTDDLGGRFADSSNQIRQVRTRLQGFEVHCQGESIDQTEDLVDAVVAACWRTIRGAVEFGSAVWTTQAPDGADYALDGEKAILAMSVKIPILNFQPTTQGNTAVVTSQTHTGYISTSFWGAQNWGAPSKWEVPEIGC